MPERVQLCQAEFALIRKSLQQSQSHLQGAAVTRF